MRQDLSKALDESLALLAGGQVTLEECLVRFPEQAAKLRPLLETYLQVLSIPQPTSSSAAFAGGKQRMLQALAEKTRRQEQSSPAALLQRIEGTARWFRNRGFRKAPALRVAMMVATMAVIVGLGSLVLLSLPTRVVDKAASPVYVNGLVEILPAESQTWEPFPEGGQARSGDRIRTGLDSSVVLVFFDGSTTSLEAETDITLVQLSAQRDGGRREIILQQWMGETANIVQPRSDQAARFEIETPTAVIAVRGTEFKVAVQIDGSTDVTVVEGFVDVTAQGTTVRVSAGRETTVLPDQSPSDTHYVSTGTPTPWPSPSAGDTDLDTVRDRHSSDEPPDITATFPPSGTLDPLATPTPTATLPIAVDATPESPDSPSEQPTHRPHPVFGTNPSDQPGPPVRPTKTPRP